MLDIHQLHTCVLLRCGQCLHIFGYLLFIPEIMNILIIGISRKVKVYAKWLAHDHGTCPGLDSAIARKREAALLTPNGVHRSQWVKGSWRASRWKWLKFVWYEHEMNQTAIEVWNELSTRSQTSTTARLLKSHANWIKEWNGIYAQGDTIMEFV